MPLFNIHSYTDESSALAAIATINTGEGIPVSADAITTSYAQPMYDERGFWWIAADDVTTAYLGAGTATDFPETEINQA